MNNKECDTHGEDHRKHCQAIKESENESHRTNHFTKIASTSESWLPIPKGSGKLPDMTS